MLKEMTGEFPALSEVFVAERDLQHYVIKFVSDLREVGGFLRSSG